VTASLTGKIQKSYINEMYELVNVASVIKIDWFSNNNLVSENIFL